MGALDESPLTTRSPRLELIGVTRRYPGVVANDGIDLRIAPGEIRGVLGENGSGKSTLMRCIYGVEQPDAGEIIWNGRQVVLRSPRVARALGMAMVFQHFSLIEPLTVIDNIRLYLDGLDGLAGDDGLVGLEGYDKDPNRIAVNLLSLSAALDLPVDPMARVDDLSPGERQRVEILRCLLLKPDLLILDEPTAALTPGEVSQLFTVLRTIAGSGCSILFISHKLPEVRALCDEVTVLRRGKVSGHGKPAAMSEAELAVLLVGEETPKLPPARTPVGSTVLLDLDGLSGARGALDDLQMQPVSMQIRSGEIIGIAGISGNGQEQLNNLISGETSARAGRLSIAGQDMTAHGPAQRYAAGLQIVPAERTHAGAIPAMSLADNLLLTNVHRYASRFWGLDRKRLASDNREVINTCDVRTPHEHAHAGTLSGGNLQKFLLGRALLDHPQVLICNHPTWGVDLRAAHAIHRRILDARSQGAAILLITEDLEEIYLLADRIGALYSGRISPLRPTSELPLHELGLWMTGGGEMRQRDAG